MRTVKSPATDGDAPGQAQALVRDIAHSFYLEEELATDDPVKLAKLEALRDAQD